MLRQLTLYYDDPARIVLIRRVDSYQGAESSCRTNYQLPCRYGLWTRGRFGGKLHASYDTVQQLCNRVRCGGSYARFMRPSCRCTARRTCNILTAYYLLNVAFETVDAATRELGRLGPTQSATNH